MRQQWVVGLFVACLSVATPSFAQFAPGAAASRSPEADRRADLSKQILEKWGNHIQEVYKTDVEQWASQMAPLFEQVGLEVLDRARSARTFDQMNNILMGQDSAPASGVSINGELVTNASDSLFGDLNRDLVYVPVTPCRILDTRLAGGQIAGNTSRGFDVTAVSSYSFQGGDNSNCNGVGAAGSFAAAVINFTVVTPAAAGYITAYPFGGTQPLAATLNYVAGDVRGNETVVRLDQGASANEMTIYAFAATHLVGDIVGYFINSNQPVYECVSTAQTIVNVDPSATANAVAPACAAGYTSTATNCTAGSWFAPFVYMAGGTCSARNNGGSATDLRASQTCCRTRIP